VTKRRVLFLCTHNSARSQMAEGFLRALGGDRFEAASAGTEATPVHPLAIRVMDEVGLDLSGHSSKTFEQFLAQPWDYVVTVCDTANERCPMFPARTTRLHWSFEDPSSAAGSEEEKLQAFRRIRDEILAKTRSWITRPEA
jgi:arsenate reductase